MLQAAMEAEVADFLGRDSYERRGAHQSAYRDGYKRRTVTTGEGPIELFVPRSHNGLGPFQFSTF
jgi:transposase-like protein